MGRNSEDAFTKSNLKECLLKYWNKEGPLFDTCLQVLRVKRTPLDGKLDGCWGVTHPPVQFDDRFGVSVLVRSNICANSIDEALVIGKY